MRYREIKRLMEDGRVVQGVNTTVDVGTDEIKRQAAKFGNTVGVDGKPNNDMWRSVKQRKKDPRVK